MAALATESPEFEEFVQTAEALRGERLDRGWLLELWTGAASNLERAINHIIDTPEDKVVRADAAPRHRPTSSAHDAADSSSGKKGKSDKKKKEKAPRSRKHASEDATSGDHDHSRSFGSNAPGFDIAPPWSQDASAFDQPPPSTGGGFSVGPHDSIGIASQWAPSPSAAARFDAPSAWGAVTSTADAPSSGWGATGDLPRCPCEPRPDPRSSSQFGAQPTSAWKATSNTMGGFTPGFSGDNSSDSENDWWGGSEIWRNGGGVPFDKGTAFPPSSFGSSFGCMNSVGNDPGSRLSQLLAHGGSQIESLVSDIYLRVCPKGGMYQDLERVVGDAIAQGGLPSDAFNNLPQMYERFDFNGDGVLDRVEMVKLVKTSLRLYKNNFFPDGAGLKDMKLPRKNINDDFVILKKLGEGGQGSMYLASLRANQNEIRCVKFYDKANANAPLDGIKEEFELMRRLNSPLVARTFEMFEDLTHVYLVNEPYFGGDLTKLIANASEAGVALSEVWFRRVFIQPAQGIEYLNQQDMMHCDLKEPNIMVVSKSDWQDPRLVLIDFGLAQNFSTDTQGVCGTPGYIPPETWQKGYWVPKGDVFSLGVIFFQLVGGIDGLFAGYMGAKTMDDIARRTMTSLPPFEVFADKVDFQSMVMRMLEKLPSSRCTISAVIQHSWFHAPSFADAGIDPQVIERIRHNKVKGEAFLQISELMLDRVNLGGMRQLNDAFMAMDADRSGTLTADEVRSALMRMGNQSPLLPQEIDAFIFSLADSSGVISYSRYMAAMIQRQRNFTSAELWAKFCEIDINRNGVLEADEILSVAKAMNYSERDAWNLMQQLDRDRDGKVTWEEFRRLMLGE